MQRWLMAGLILLLVFGLAPSIVAGSDQWDEHTWSQLVELVNNAIAVSNDFMDQANTSSVDIGTIIGLTGPLANRLTEINQQIADLPPAPNDTVAAAMMTFQVGISQYVRGLTEMQTSYNFGDSSRWNNAITEINGGIDNMNQAKETFRQQDTSSSKATDEREIHQLIVIGTVLFATLSAGLLILGLHGGPFAADQARAGAFLMMFKTSLIPTIGFLITLGTYAAAKNGGTYLIATGAMLFGGFRLFRQIVLYATQLRPQLNDIGQAERLVDEYGDDLWALFTSHPGPAFAAAVAQQFHVSAGAAAIVAAQLAAVEPGPTSPAISPIADADAQLRQSG